MKKAFEDNLPRVKPRVRFNAPVESVPTEATASPAGFEPAVADPVAASAELRAAVQSAAEAALREDRPVTEEHPVAPASPPESGRRPVANAGPSLLRDEPSPSPRAVDSREPPADQRRRKLRNRLWAIQHQVVQAKPEGPGEVLAAAEGLALELTEARARASRFERELTRARADLSTAVAEAEAERQRVDAQHAQLGEARQLLAGLEVELSMLEEERDEVLTEVRLLRQADGARRESLTALSQELDEARRGVAEARAEQVEIVRELEAGDIEIGRLTHELKRVEGERSRLLEELTELSGTKGELADSRRTLERVHQLLAVAATVKRK
jgi:hypothetical protein